MSDLGQMRRIGMDQESNADLPVRCAIFVCRTAYDSLMQRGSRQEFSRAKAAV